MRIWNLRWARYGILSLLIVASAAALSEARFFYFWWFRPPIPAIQDVTFDSVAANFARLRFISVTSGVGFTQNVSTFLNQDTTIPVTASVSDDGTMLSIDPILLSSMTTRTNPNNDVVKTQTEVIVDINKAPVLNTYFNAYARIDGLATVTVTETINGVQGTPQVVNVPIFFYGTIHTHTFTNEYHLRGSVRGFFSEYDSGVYNYAFLSMFLDSTTAIPAP